LPSKTTVCKWLTLTDALTAFVKNEHGVQSQRHIKPLHWYSACRLVVEGGFLPECLTPRPPFVVQRSSGRYVLTHDPSAATGGERSILGGLKTKTVDVVVSQDGIGPCVAISHKGALGAFRNLTNRLEEAVGDCTNIHITYPALVYGFLVAIRANRRSVEQGIKEIEDALSDGGSRTADIAMQDDGSPAEMIRRFHQAISELTGRRGVRNDVSRYEAIALALVDPDAKSVGLVLPGFPPPDSPLRLDRFFADIYRRYDERYVLAAPDLATTTKRVHWASKSPIFQPALNTILSGLDYEPRIADD
jgi:hypothetical protein